MTVTKHFKIAKFLAKLLDNQFEILGIRFGLDPILGLIPSVGNIVTTIISCYLFLLAYRLRVTKDVYFQMIFHIVLDFLISSIPVFGNISDFFYKSNEKNLKLLSLYVDDEVLEGRVIS